MSAGGTSAGDEAMTLPTRTRAAVMHQYKAPLSLEDVPLPAELEPGAALVKINATTLCGTDAHIWDGLLADAMTVAIPLIGGHEMVGTVVAIDPAATTDALGRQIGVGDRIVWSEAVCGHCYGCTMLGEVFCEHRGFGFLQAADQPPYATGGLSEYVYVVPGAHRLLVEPEIKDAWAAAAGCAVKTMLRAFRNAGGVPPGASVVIQGSGPLGLFAVAYARACGAGKVIVIGAPERRLEVARQWGADHTISLDEVTTPDARVAAVSELTEGRGAELVLNFATGPTAVHEGALMVGTRGCYVIVGLSGPGAEPLPLEAVMGREIRIQGSLNGDVRDLAESLRFLRDNRRRFDWDLMFDEPVGLDRASEAIASMSALEAIKPVIRP